MKKKCESAGPEVRPVGCDVRKVDQPVCNRPRWHKGTCRGNSYIWFGTGGCRVAEMRWRRGVKYAHEMK
jgi:hypothetical protein